jgi:hypothetical protein
MHFLANLAGSVDQYTSTGNGTYEMTLKQEKASGIFMFLFLRR